MLATGLSVFAIALHPKFNQLELQAQRSNGFQLLSMTKLFHVFRLYTREQLIMISALSPGPLGVAAQKQLKVNALLIGVLVMVADAAGSIFHYPTLSFLASLHS